MPARRRAGAGRDRTSRLLLEIRGDIRQADAAARSGLTQSKISRAEQSTGTLSAEEADHYARVLGASAAQRRELVELCRAAAAEAITGRSRLVRQAASIQRRVGLLERQSRQVRAWVPDVVPGLFQTWDYTLAVIGLEPDEQWVQRRRERLTLLAEPGRRLDVLMSETALRWVLGSSTLMADQLDHLVALSRRPSIALGVLPFGPVLPPPTEGGFYVFDERVAVVATDVGTTFLEDRADLAHYRAQFDRLSAAALRGEDARELIAAIAREHRARP